MKNSMFLILVSALFLLSCNEDPVIEEPNEKEEEQSPDSYQDQFTMTGYFNGAYHIFQWSGGGMSLSSPLYDDDSIRISMGPEFKQNIDGKEVGIRFNRSRWIPKAQLVPSEMMLQDTIQMYTFQFIEFEDFADIFKVGEYGGSGKDRVYTFVTVRDTALSWYYSYYQPDSLLFFAIDSMKKDAGNQSVWIKGRFSSTNSISREETADIIHLDDFKFTAIMKNSNPPPVFKGADSELSFTYPAE